MVKARLYVQAALAWLGKQDPSSLHRSERVTRRWNRVAANLYHWQVESRVEWLAFFAHAAALHSLPEYLSALAALEADPIISPQLDQMVGAGGGSSRLMKETILDGIAVHAAEGAELEFNEAAFSAAYLASETELYANTITFLTLAPVIGLSSAPPIKFGQIELDRMTDEEAAFLLDTGQVQSSFSTRDVVQTTTEYVLRQRVALPKYIGEAPSGTAQRPDISDALLTILSSMRLLKEGTVGVPAVITRWPTHTTWSPLAQARNVHVPMYSLNDAEAGELVTLWSQLSSPAVDRREFIGGAIRRFSYGGERARVEDRFIDLMIAAEAMFLGERRKGETTGELTQKISTRFAFFMTSPNVTRRQLYDHMKKGYGIRSKVVHGDRPKGMRKPGELEKFTDATADYLRQALRQMVAMAHLNPSRKPLIDWDELILGRSD